LPLRESLIKIYDITAPSLIFTTLLLVCGFGVFALGDFVPNIYFGILCALILTLGVFLELLFTPALLIALDKILTKVKK
jgi:predicted RND superfamily exporter protein